MDEPLYKCVPIYGKIECRSWLEMRDGKLVGMGSRTEYDEHGKIISHRVNETGCELSFPD